MRAMPIVILLALAACSAPFGGGGDARPVLVNQTGHALLYVAFDLADGPLVDPMPAIDPAQAPERLVAAGGQAAIEISEHSGTGVLLFLYEIPSADHAGPVPLSRTVHVPQADLLRMHHRIVIGEQ